MERTWWWWRRKVVTNITEIKWLSNLKVKILSHLYLRSPLFVSLLTVCQMDVLYSESDKWTTGRHLLMRNKVEAPFEYDISTDAYPACPSESCVTAQRWWMDLSRLSDPSSIEPVKETTRGKWARSSWCRSVCWIEDESKQVSHMM